MTPWVSSTVKQECDGHVQCAQPRPVPWGLRAGGALDCGQAGAAPSYGAAEEACSHGQPACALAESVSEGTVGDPEGEVTQEAERKVKTVLTEKTMWPGGWRGP